MQIHKATKPHTHRVAGPNCPLTMLTNISRCWGKCYYSTLALSGNQSKCNAFSRSAASGIWESSIWYSLCTGTRMMSCAKMSTFSGPSTYTCWVVFQQSFQNECVHSMQDTPHPNKTKHPIQKIQFFEYGIRKTTYMYECMCTLDRGFS